jgi:uridylate kinase
LSRILLKLSGESLGKSGISGDITKKLAKEIAAINKAGIAIAIVIGGGNIWRFRDNAQKKFLPRVQSDFLGMLATIFNGVALAAALRELKIKTEVFTALRTPTELAQTYSITAARKILANKGVVILTGGTGKPFVTTDSAAAMRAVELKCNRVLKATNVRGVYSADPRKNKKAKFLSQLSFSQALIKKIGVMDSKAFQILKQNKMPLIIFNFSKKGLLARAASGENVGTEIKD